MNTSKKNSRIFNRGIYPKKRLAACFDFDFIINALLVLYTLLFIMFNTLPAKPVIKWVERLEIIVGGLLFAAAAVKFFAEKEDRHLLKRRPLILICVYVAIRFISWKSAGFDYSTIRTVYFEIIYLVAINEMIVSKRLLKRRILPLLILINLSLNIMECLCFAFIKISPDGYVSQLLTKYTFFDLMDSRSFMYINPNTMGIMTAFAMISMFIILPKDLLRVHKILAGIYFGFSLVILINSHCRSAELAVFIAVLSYIIVKYIKILNAKKLTLCLLVLSVFATGAIYGYMHAHSQSGVAVGWMHSFDENEYKLNLKSSGRYNIWKTGMLASEGKKLFGSGSLTGEMADRNAYAKEFWSEKYSDQLEFEPTVLGPHSGYFGMLFTTGFAGFFIYISLLFYMISKSKLMDKDNWYLAMIFIIIVNHLECFFIVSRFFICLMMLLILSARDDEDESEALDVYLLNLSN